MKMKLGENFKQDSLKWMSIIPRIMHFSERVTTLINHIYISHGFLKARYGSAFIGNDNHVVWKYSFSAYLTLYYEKQSHESEVSCCCSYYHQRVEWNVHGKSDSRATDPTKHLAHFTQKQSVRYQYQNGLEAVAKKKITEDNFTHFSDFGDGVGVPTNESIRLPGFHNVGIGADGTSHQSLAGKTFSQDFGQISRLLAVKIVVLGQTTCKVLQSLNSTATP